MVVERRFHNYYCCLDIGVVFVFVDIVIGGDSIRSIILFLMIVLDCHVDAASAWRIKKFNNYFQVSIF